MKRVALAVVSTITGLVLLLSFKTHALGTAAKPPAAVASSSGTAASSAGTTGTSSGTATSTGGTTARKKSQTSRHASTSHSSTASRSVTVTGAAVDTMYGPVQVSITVKNGKITAANAIEYPNQDPRDAQINYYAIPILQQETVQASSANISHVSGATYTSQGYIESLQSALNKAGL